MPTHCSARAGKRLLRNERTVLAVSGKTMGDVSTSVDLHTYRSAAPPVLSCRNKHGRLIRGQISWLSGALNSMTCRRHERGPQTGCELVQRGSGSGPPRHVSFRFCLLLLDGGLFRTDGGTFSNAYFVGEHYRKWERVHAPPPYYSPLPLNGKHKSNIVLALAKSKTRKQKQNSPEKNSYKNSQSDNVVKMSDDI